MSIDAQILPPAARELSHHMAAQGLGVRELVRQAEARGIKLNVSAVSDIMNGKREPDPETARRLGAFFTVPAATFRPDLADFAATDPLRRRAPLGQLILADINERKQVDVADTAALADDILERGLLENLVTYPHAVDGLDMVLAVAGGGRRWRALKLQEATGRLAQAPGNLDTMGIPVLIRPDRKSAMVDTVAENAHQSKVHFVDRAASLALLRAEFGWSAGQIAKAINTLGERAVQQHLQIHDRLSDADKARALAGGLTYREARDLVQAHKPEPVFRGIDSAKDYLAEAGEVIVSIRQPTAAPSDTPLPLGLPATVADYSAAAPPREDFDQPPVSVRLIELLSDITGIPASQITRATALVEDLDIEPHLSALQSDIALRFDAQITAFDWEHIGTVGELTRVVINRMGPAPSAVKQEEAKTPEPGSPPPQAAPSEADKRWAGYANDAQCRKTWKERRSLPDGMRLAIEAEYTRRWPNGHPDDIKAPRHVAGLPYGYSCTGASLSPGIGLTSITLCETKTGRQMTFVLEQRDIEEG